MNDLNQFQFRCSSCEEIHIGIPNLGANAPIYYYRIPEEEINKRVFLTSDTCVIDDEYFYVKGCLEFPVIGYNANFSFGAWVSLSNENFLKFELLFNKEIRDKESPMFGWLSSWIWMALL